MTTGSIRIAMTSDVGLRRKNNQDTGFAQQGVFMVCDGMGGGKGGELHVDDLVAIGCGAHAGDPLAGEGVDNVAAGVDRDHGAHLDGAERHGGSSETGLHAGGGPHELSDGGTRAGTYIALLERGGGVVECLMHGGDAGLYVGAHGGIAKGEVEDLSLIHISEPTRP